MADKKFDGVVEAVHYGPDGKVDWVRAYLRRGPAWSDRVIIRRQELIDEIKSGKNLVIGERIEFMGGTFDVSKSIQIQGSEGQEVLVTSNSSQDGDHLEGAAIL